MDLKVARDLAIYYMKDELGSRGVAGWTFRFDNAYRTFGRCFYKRKLITLSAALVKSNSVEQVRETILHEIAHALAWHFEKHVGHGPVWKQWAVKVGAQPRRCYSPEEVNTVYKWWAICPSCERYSGVLVRRKDWICRFCRSADGRRVHLRYSKIKPSKPNPTVLTLTPTPDYIGDSKRGRGMDNPSATITPDPTQGEDSMAEDTITYSKKDLDEKTVSELKLIAEDLDMSPTDVKEMTGSTSSHPTKTDYITAILLNTSGETSSPPASAEEAAPAADPEAEWPITSPKSAAAVYRAGLRNGISREGIEAAVKEFFPTYEAQKIAYSNYRRDLIKKGLLVVKDKKKDTNE